MKLILTLICSLLLTSCSLFTNESIESEQNSASKIIASARLYLSSGLLGRQEFEQYSLSGSAIFFECGDLRKDKIRVKSSIVIDLDQEQRDKLSLSILEIIGMASVNSKLTEKNNTKISDQASLNVTTIDGKNAILALSFRQILLTEKELENKFGQLITEIRSIMKQQLSSEQFCDNEHFYGLE